MNLKEERRYLAATIRNRIPEITKENQDDMIQDIFLAYLEKKDKVRAGEERGYMIGILKYHVLAHFRTLYKRRAVIVPDMEESALKAFKSSYLSPEDSTDINIFMKYVGKPQPKVKKTGRSTAIEAINRVLGSILSFNSIKEATLSLGIPKSTITNSCLRQSIGIGSKQKSNWIFRYKQ